jgi:hypothetical protein
MFRGNTKPERLWKNMEFVWALIDWTRDVSIQCLTLDNFVDFVKTNKKQYKHLNEFLPHCVKENQVCA